MRRTRIGYMSRYIYYHPAQAARLTEEATSREIVAEVRWIESWVTAPSFQSPRPRLSALWVLAHRLGRYRPFK